MPKHLKKISEETIHSNPWWVYKHDTYEIDENKTGDYYYGENNGSVLVVPILDDGRLILVVQHRYLRDKPSIEFVCGGIDVNEEPLKAAAREMREEIGYTSSEFMKIGHFDSLNGLFKDTSHIFIANELTQAGAPEPDETENLEIIYRRVDEFENMIRSGEIWDGQTLAVWALAREYVYKFLASHQTPQ
ncbi:MAG: hypothetical protein US58_C0024G0012 [Candidatus Magasanikbacteria bacterium GW2011_GWA2_37_8]|uniref:Nudix hydrolase domain-containing protein n=1 Tax=Candidatus Magasanikbacteria bacterium GW2011_GWA2_37_8 TaxID=1619036 RepID=A0A0G0KHH2_9BACT|nr:MAG: hypothetical protein US58_C0024G0012 [Candidatus Magasanikbacteria bacterium GW2011_GWA2_37_8]